MQNHHKTKMNLWNRTLKLCKQIEYNYYLKKTNQNLENNVPSYISNQFLHQNLRVLFINEVIQTRYTKYS